MYRELKDFTLRPAPFSRLTTRELWTRPHLARQMLSYHLDQSNALASRPADEIDAIVRWLDTRIALEGKTLCDLGCGPGLYAERFARLGATVTGIDVSTHSLEHARSESARKGLDVRYLHADYIADPLPHDFDAVTLIYFDYCALPPEHRKSLLSKIHAMLRPGGHLAMDVMGMGTFITKNECLTVEQRLMNGFWADTEYVGLHRTVLYPDEAVSLDHYLIVETGTHWQIYNWLQYFTVERLSFELSEAGFDVASLTSTLAGDPHTGASDTIAVIAAT